MRELDLVGGADAIEGWFTGRLPIPERVEVLWFALWDVTTGFDLRGSSAWSRNPKDWAWCYHDDFDAGSYASRPLAAMHELAGAVEDPDEGPDVEGGVWELMDSVLTLGFVSLAAQQVMRGLNAADVLAGRAELAVVSGFPDAVYGLILGRLAAAGFEPGDNHYREARSARPAAAKVRPLRTAHVYEVKFDPAIEDQWHLDDPIDPKGREIDGNIFTRGERVDITGELVVPIHLIGQPLDFSFAAGLVPVVTDAIGSLLKELAPQDIQLIAARVESMDKPYQILNILSRRRHRPRADARPVVVPDDPDPYRPSQWSTRQPMPSATPRLRATTSLIAR